MAVDLSRNLVTHHWIPLSVQVYKYVMNIQVVFTVCLSVCICVSSSICYIFLSVLFPCIDHRLSLVWNFPPPGWRPILPPAEDLNPFGSVRSPRETKPKEKKNNLRAETRACYVAWLLVISGLVPMWKCGGAGPLIQDSNPLSYKQNEHRVGENSSPRWTFPPLCACS